MPSKCESCSKEDARFRCGVCNNASYCNKDCQITAWKAHKLTCVEMPAQTTTTSKDSTKRLNIVLVGGDRATKAVIAANEIDHTWQDCIVPGMLGYPVKYKRMKHHAVKPSREVAIFMFVDPVSGLADSEWQVGCGVVAFAFENADFSVQLFWDLYSYIFHLMDYYGVSNFNYAKFSKVHLQRSAFLNYQAKEHQIQAGF